MPQDKRLIGKTFDQQFELVGDSVVSQDISPNRRIPAEIVFEPMGTGVRVTARDAEHALLWGYIGSEGALKHIHCLVAVYDRLQELLAEELRKRGVMKSDAGEAVSSSVDAIDELQATVDWLKEGLQVKKISDATLERARTIARIVSDANRQILLEAATLKGMKPKPGLVT